jgi:hypothetical protein
MMNPQHVDATSVQDVASNYRAWGYDVVIDPSPQDLPPFLNGYQPDFLARKDGETVLVQVKPIVSTKDMEGYRALAERVHAQPAWRLDLVVTGSPDRIQGARTHPLLPAIDVSIRYEEAEQLAATGHGEAALLIAWAATEAVLRLTAEFNGTDVQRSSTPTLLKHLVTEGIISREEYQLLWSSYQTRSLVAHGFATRERADTADTMIALGRRLLMDLRQAA